MALRLPKTAFRIFHHSRHSHEDQGTVHNLAGGGDPNDLVFGATHVPGARVHIMVNIRKKNGEKYSVLLITPANILEQVLAAINETQGLILREVGELELPLV